VRFCYADPPYYGLAVKFYGDLHPEAAEYDKLETHAALVKRLCQEFDGWAMSLHERSLRDILPLCPREARTMAWVKSFASFKPTNPAAQWAWEPVIVWGGRKLETPHCVRDWVSCRIAIQKGLRGGKPSELIDWVLDVLGATPEDDIVDMFPGSGAVTAAIDNWRRGGGAMPLFSTANSVNHVTSVGV
jgi:hypothetical protein